jgi:hypothetical protein
MRTIFVSYRRADSLVEAKCLKKKLTEWFGNELVFRDEDAIPLGFDFRDVIRESLGESLAVLVVLGENWLDAKDDSGRRRLDVEDDPVRVEVELALSSKVPVIPVLIRSAKLPPAEALPEKLKPLRYRNAVVFDPEAGDESALNALREDLADYVVAGRGERGASRRDAKGRYIPSGVSFVEWQTGWSLKAHHEVLPLRAYHWPGNFLSVTLSLVILGLIVGAVPMIIWREPGSISAPIFGSVREDFVVYFDLLLGLPFVLGILLCLPFVRRPYHTWLNNRFGSTGISLRGEVLRVSDGLPFVSRVVAANLDSVESFQIREEGFALVVNWGGRLDILKCYEFGKRLSIAKRLFIARSMSKLLVEPTAAKSESGTQVLLGQDRI